MTDDLEKVPDTFRGNFLIFQERGFNSSATRGERADHPEAVSPGDLFM